MPLEPKSQEFVPTSEDDDSEASDVEEQKKKKKQSKENKKKEVKKVSEKRVCYINKKIKKLLKPVLFTSSKC